MKISKKDWQNYINRLRKINEKAAEKVAVFMETHDCSTPEGTRLLIDYAHAVATKYGEGAAELSCQMLDAVADASKVFVPAAEPAATATYGEIARTIYGTMARTRNPQAIGAAVGRSVKLASVDTLQQNALRDGAEWAWIPNGDTCPFCIMLASRGWEPASKKAIKNGHAEHIHNNCDCTYCIRYDGETTVEGYGNGEKYRAMYKDQEGIDPNILKEVVKDGYDLNTPKGRMIALSRAHRAANRDYINAQKRVAYKRQIEEDIKAVIASHNNEYKKYLETVLADAANLKRRQKRLLDRVPEHYSWITVKARNLHIRDIAAMTAATGDEFAIFQRNGKKILVRGKGSKWYLPDELFKKLMDEKWIWEGHSHPVLGKPDSSPEDRRTLSRFTWQEKSAIINLKGEVKEFTGNEQDWFNEYLGVK